MLRFIAVKDRSQPVATGCYGPVFFRSFVSESERPRPVVRSFSGPVRSSLRSFCGPRTGPANTTTKEIPLLTGKHDWGPWHTAVWTLIDCSNLLGHIHDTMLPGALYDPDLEPT